MTPFVQYNTNNTKCPYCTLGVLGIFAFVSAYAEHPHMRKIRIHLDLRIRIDRCGTGADVDRKERGRLESCRLERAELLMHPEYPCCTPIWTQNPKYRVDKQSFKINIK